jgi:hypothetical protein
MKEIVIKKSKKKQPLNLTSQTRTRLKPLLGHARIKWEDAQ